MPLSLRRPNHAACLLTARSMMLGAVLFPWAESRAQTTPQPVPAPAGTVQTVISAQPQENLTVHGQRPRFQAAPVPGAPLGPPPASPSGQAPHLGRYKITGSQPGPGYDPHTGAYIAPFGGAYTQAGPVANGLATRFNH